MRRILFVLGLVIALVGVVAGADALASKEPWRSPLDAAAGGGILLAFGMFLSWLTRPWADQRSRGGPGLNPHMWADVALDSYNHDSSSDSGDSDGDSGGDVD